MDVYEQLKELGIELPAPPPPGGIYSPTIEFNGNLVYTSGVGPTDPTGAPMFTGRLGEDLSIEQGQEAARLTMLNLLGLLHTNLGDLRRINRIVKLLGFVASANDFYSQPQVMNGASRLLLDVFGEPAGKPARSAIGVNVLPINIPVEIELLLELNK